MRNYQKKRNHPKSIEIKVLAQHLNLSVSKAQRVIDQIRGRSYDQTIEILLLKPNKACYPIRRLIMSAALNAFHYHDMHLNEVNSYIHKAEVNRGSIVKKSRPRAKGHSYPIKRTMCHILIVLKEGNHIKYKRIK